MSNKKELRGAEKVWLEWVGVEFYFPQLHFHSSVNPIDSKTALHSTLTAIRTPDSTINYSFLNNTIY